MKKLPLFVTLLGLGQVSAQELTPQDLTAPAIPAFTILDLSPTTVNRPTSPKSFAMSLANGLNGTGLASNLAIEATPYWFWDQPDVSFQKFYGLQEADKRSFLSKVGDQILWSTAISIATSDASPNVDSVNSRNLSFGLRFNLLPGKASSKFLNKYYDVNQQARLESVIMNLLDEVNTVSTYADLQALVTREIETSVNASASLDADEKETMKEWLQTRINQGIQGLENSYTPGAGTEALTALGNAVSDSTFSKLDKLSGIDRVGWLLQVAGASYLQAPTNNIEYTLGEDWAVWATLTYRLDEKEGSSNCNDFNLMLRKSGNWRITNTSNLDIGLSWTSTGSNHNLSLEAVVRSYQVYKDITATDGQTYRVKDTSGGTWRLALAYQQKFTENLGLSLSLGKDFDNSTLTAGGMFTLLGLNVSLPNDTKIKL